MQKIFKPLLLILVLLPFVGLAQVKYTISGTIKDKINGELMIGVTIKVDEHSNLTTTTNEYGFYSISLPQGNYGLTISYVGYEEQNQMIQLSNNIIFNIFLKAKLRNELSEVMVSNSRKGRNLTTSQMGTEVLNIKSIEKLPVLFGEKMF